MELLLFCRKFSNYPYQCYLRLVPTGVQVLSFSLKLIKLAELSVIGLQQTHQFLEYDTLCWSLALSFMYVVYQQAARSQLDGRALQQHRGALGALRLWHRLICVFETGYVYLSWYELAATLLLKPHDFPG